MAADEAICRSFLEKDLTCRMCLDIFVDATLLPICGHTFCRSCLKRCNESYDQQVVYIRCSVCEKINNLTSEKGFDDLPANETVNKIVDNYIQDRVCKTAPRQKCTACRRPEDAVSFCRTCHKYLCEGCQTSHREMFDYEGHETVPFDFEKMLVKEKNESPPPNRTTLRTGPKKFLELSAKMRTMAHYSSPKSVAIGYDKGGVNIVDVQCKEIPCRKIPSDTRCDSIVFPKKDVSFCILNENRVHIYSHTGDEIPTGEYPSNFFVKTMNEGLLGEIIITSLEKKLYIYDSALTMLTRPQHTFETEHITHQASAARPSGKIVTSSSTFRLSVVTVYDRNGRPGESLQAPEGVYLYTAVDEHDRVYVASVNRWSGEVVIRLYKIEGLNLEESNEFNEINFRCTWSGRCSLVFLPAADTLAFAYSDSLHFFQLTS